MTPKASDGQDGSDGMSGIPAAWLDLLGRTLKAKRLTKQALADAVALSKPTITRLFQGRGSPTTIRHVAVYLNLPDPLALHPDVDPSEEWLELGQDLLVNDPHMFATIVEYMRAARLAREKRAQLAHDLAK